MGRKHISVVLIACLMVGLLPGVVIAQDLALAVYGGRLTREKWQRAISPGAPPMPPVSLKSNSKPTATAAGG